MDFSKKFQHKLRCICNVDVIFEVIDDVECDWGTHTLIQCPACEELFSIDKKCIAFQNILELLQNNPELYSKEEKFRYALDSHHD